MGRRRFIKNTLAVIVGGGLLLAPSSVQAVGKGLETIAGEGEKPVDDKAREIIDSFQGSGCYSRLENKDYDWVINNYQDDANFLMEYNLEGLDEDRIETAGIMLNNVGTALRKKGNCQDAITYFKREVELDPNSLAGHGALGFCHVKLRRWEDALREYKITFNLCEDEGCRNHTSKYIQRIESILNK